MFDNIITYLINNKDIFAIAGVFFVFVFSFFESTPFLGLIVPTQTLLILSGFFVQAIDINFYKIFVSATIGSIAGDIFSFYIGKKYGNKILIEKGFKFLIKKEYIEKTKELVEKHLGKTLFWGRISSIPRSIAPFVAGSSKTDFKKFVFWATLGALLWSYSIIGIGYVFGASFEIIGPMVGKFVFSTLITSLLIISTLIYFKKKHFYITSRHITLITACLTSIFIFGLIGEAVLEQNETLRIINTSVKEFVENIRNDQLNKLMIVITSFGDKIALISLSIILSVYLYLKKHKKQSYVLILSMMIGALLVYITKYLTHSDRPLFGIIEETGKSFPSGHSTLSMIFIISLIIPFVKKIKKEHLLWITLGGGMIFPLIIGFSRIYLGVHWFTDVFGGFALGIFVGTFCVLLADFVPWFYKKIKNRQIAPNL